MAQKTIDYVLSGDQFRDMMGSYLDSPQFDWITVTLSPKFFVVKIIENSTGKTYRIHRNRLETIILEIATGSYQVADFYRQPFQDLVFGGQTPIFYDSVAIDILLQISCFGKVLYG
jgi:hypothetical protein